MNQSTTFPMATSTAKPGRWHTQHLTKRLHRPRTTSAAPTPKSNWLARYSLSSTFTSVDLGGANLDGAELSGSFADVAWSDLTL